MRKIFLISKTEFLKRITKRSFIWLTFLGPLIISLVLIVPIGLAMSKTKFHTIEVLDLTSQYVSNDFPVGQDRSYILMTGSYKTILANFLISNNDALLIIPPGSIYDVSDVKLFQNRPLSKSTIESIQADVNKVIANYVSMDIKNDNPKAARLLKGVKMSTQLLSIDEQGKDSAFVIALGLGMCIYMFIFVYAVQVMRSIVEDKVDRIIEILITSVRPIQLMAGKIIGIGLVGLTQFMLWLLLSWFITYPIYKYFKIDRFNNENIAETLKYVSDTEQALELNFILNGISNIQFPVLLVCFLAYFILGFIIYAGLFACIGAMVDNETDSQQFVVPVTAPMVGTILLMQVITQDSGSSLSIGLSMFPLTSPIAMMLRLPFGVNFSEIFISLLLLFSATLLILWLSGKIYRTGILMYGKKASFSEVYRWLVEKG